MTCRLMKKAVFRRWSMSVSVRTAAVCWKSAGYGADTFGGGCAEKTVDSNYIPPVQGKKWPCILAGSISIAFSLFMFAVALFAGEPVALPNAAAILLMLLPMFVFGLALLLCRHIEPNQSQPIVVMREQKAVTIIGMILWLFGAVLLFMGIAVRWLSLLMVLLLFFGLTGSFVFFFGTWMLLADAIERCSYFRINRFGISAVGEGSESLKRGRWLLCV